MKNIKRIICAAFAALTLTAALSGCGNEDSSSSVVSDMKSNAKKLVSDIREEITQAQTDITEAVERMYSGGQVSDGDGIIGNEGSRDE